MKEDIANVLEFPTWRKIANYYEGDVCGKIPATRLVYFDEIKNTSDREFEIFDKYDSLVARGIDDLSLGDVYQILECFPNSIVGGGVGREMYINIVA